MFAPSSTKLRRIDVFRLYYRAKRSIGQVYENMDECEGDPELEREYRDLEDLLYEDLFDEAELAEELADNPKNFLFPADDCTRKYHGRGAK